MNTNMNEAPRPLNLGEILDRTIQLYRERFLVYLGIAIIPTGVLLIFAGSIVLVLAWLGARPGASAAGPANPALTLAIGIAVVVVISLPALAALLGVSALSTAAMSLAAAGALAGRRPTIRGSYAEAWRRGWMYTGLYILQSLIVWVAPLFVWFIALIFLTLIAGAAGRGTPGQAAGALVGSLTLFGFMAVAGYALWMLLCVSLAFPGCVVEKIAAGDALKRSFRLSKGTRGRIFVLYLLGAALGWILSIVVTVIFAIAVALIPALNSPQNAQAMGMAVLFLIYGSSFAVQAFTKPVYSIALMLFYYDQRIRNEGFDIEWMMERAGLVAGVATAPIELRTEPGGEGPAAAPGFETVRKDDAFDGARGLVPLQAPEQTEDAETTEAAEATQPESGVQS
jgi:hypothetical protein